MKPLGLGPEQFLPPASWPSAPLLILGPEGSGRRTWAEHLLQEWDAKDYATLKSDEFLTTTVARSMGEEFFKLKSPVTKWVSFTLDGAKKSAQNAMLKTLEELPDNTRVILRARPGEVLTTVRSRCAIVSLIPDKPQAEMDLLESHGLSPEDAEQLVELRPGRPGAAMALASALAVRPKANSLLSAAEARDHLALSMGLSDFDPGCLFWFQEWVDSALSDRCTVYLAMAKQAGPLKLSAVKRLLTEVPNARLAVRAAVTALATRSE